MIDDLGSGLERLIIGAIFEIAAEWQN